MIPFLKQFSIDIYEKYKEDFSNICIVMPTRRAQKYFIHYLSQHINKTILLPEIHTIDEFICSLTSYKTIDNTELLLILFNYHIKTNPETIHDFKHFLGWASLFLSDINEIDMQLADAKNIFTSLTEIKELSYYDTPENERTLMQKNYLKFFDELFQNYQYLNDYLSTKSIGYQGLIYRKAAEEINLLNATSKWRKVIFCGFNALTKSEIKIIKNLMSENQAEIYFDADYHYFNDELSDAGYFLRNSKKDFKLNDNFPYISNYFEQYPKNIRIIGAPNAISQAKLAGEIVSDLQTNNTNTNESTAIVPADENLLPALMNTISPNNVNITMGVPLKTNIIYKLYSLIFGMHINVERSLNQSNRKERYLYYKDVIGIFSHPAFNKLAAYFNSSMIDASNHLTIQNIVYCNTNIIEKLNGITPEFISNISSIFMKYEDYSIFFKELKNFNQILKSVFNEKKSLNDVFTKNALIYFDEVFDFLETLNQNYSINNNPEFIFSLFNSKVSEYSISFTGDAIQGTQLMGLLETRLLDFDNIILVSVNEEILPSGKTTNSLLPFDLRRYFKLNSHIQKDAIYSYHFFRLIQRAKNVSIIYNADLKDGKSEKSRYINQLIYDIAPKYDNINIQESILNISPNIDPAQKIIINKEGAVLNLLSQVTSLSPSAISNYIQCPLKFYFYSVAKIQEIEEITESTDDKMLGNIIHGVLEKVYKQFSKDHKLSDNDFQKISESDLFEKIENEYENLRNFKIQREELKFGKNRLAFEVIKNFISAFFNKEILEVKSNEIIPIDFEQLIETNISISSKIINSIKLKGIVDRIDLFNGITRIIDYKTGKVEKNNLTFSNITQLFTEPKLAKSLQLFCYSLLYSKHYNLGMNVLIQPMIFSFKSKEIYSQITFNEINTLTLQDINEFEKHLATLISNIFDTSVPFIQTNDEKQCVNCQFSGKCNINSIEENDSQILE